MIESNTDELLSVRQAAGVLRKSLKTIRRWVHAGRLEARSAQGDRRLFVTQKSVLAARRLDRGHEALLEERFLVALSELNRRLDDIEGRLANLDTLRWPKSANERRIADIIANSVMWQLEHVIDRGEPPSLKRHPVRSQRLEAHLRRFHPEIFSDAESRSALQLAPIVEVGAMPR